jgi:tRNA dimethylallyltransferase
MADAPHAHPRLGGMTLVALVGPTASGKSAIALEVARALGDVEIVTVDSMQVYRGLDIGTAKPTAAERAEVPHHLLDLVDVEDEFSVAEFQRAARTAIDGIVARGARPLLVGGTGLYVRAVVDDLELPGQFPAVRAELEQEPDTAALHARLATLDPLAASRTTDSNRRRIERALEVTIGSGRPFSSFGPGLDAYPAGPVLVGVDVPLDELDRLIEARVAGMLEAGLLEETAALQGRTLSRTASRALGYEELLDHLAGRRTLAEAVDETIRRTRRLARRQLRWFRRDPRLIWAPPASAAAVVIRRLTDSDERPYDHAT